MSTTSSQGEGRLRPALRRGDRGRLATAGDPRRHRRPRARSSGTAPSPPARRSAASATSSGAGSSPPILFGWISTRAEQAIAEEIDTELAVRMTGLDPEPWDAGAVASILPELAETSDIDWTMPLAQWPRETMIDFLLTATRLIRKAEIARDLSEPRHHQKSSAGVDRTRG